MVGVMVVPLPLPLLVPLVGEAVRLCAEPPVVGLVIRREVRVNKHITERWRNRTTKQIWKMRSEEVISLSSDNDHLPVCHNKYVIRRTVKRELALTLNNQTEHAVPAILIPTQYNAKWQTCNQAPPNFTLESIIVE